MKRILVYLLLIIFCALQLMGCSSGISDETNSEISEIREIAYNWLDDTSKGEILNSDTAYVDELTFWTEHLVWTKTDSVDIKNIKTYRVAFNTEKDDLLGSIVIYIDRDTLKVLGMDLRE